jgi:hypothetical protein
MSTKLLPAVALVMAFTSLACRADSYPAGASRPEKNELLAQQASTRKIAITVGDKVFTATVADSTTARDFVALLPLTLTMKDLFKREKWADLPRPLSEGGERVRTYQVGDVIYWSPSDHVAIYYRHDGQSIPSPGIIVLARIESGTDALNVPGDVKVTIEAVK